MVHLTESCILVSKYFLLEEKGFDGLAHVRRLLFAAKDRIEIYTNTFMWLFVINMKNTFKTCFLKT